MTYVDLTTPADLAVSRHSAALTLHEHTFGDAPVVTLEEAARAALWRARREWLLLAGVITFASVAIPDWIYQKTFTLGPWRAPHNLITLVRFNYQIYWHFLLVAFALPLALSSPVRSGLVIGKLRGNVGRLLLVLGVPLLLTAIIYPRLPVRPFGRSDPGGWLLSPLGQDLLFAGFLFGKLDVLFPARVHRRLPITWAIVLTAAYFALWHLPNVLVIAPGYVVFQMGYVFAGALLAGLTRLWTGSMLYITLAHMAGNFIPWWLG